MVLLALAGVLVAGIVVWRWPEPTHDGQARAAAERYLGALATGDADDLREVWESTLAEDPADLRVAGDFLARAEERLEVVEVGEAAAAGESEVGGVGVEDVWDVAVRYRVGEQERAGTIRVGLVAGATGDDVDDWRILAPLTGELSVDRALQGRIHRGETVSIGDAVLFSDAAAVWQDLYPAVYPVRAEFGDAMTGRAVSTTVLGGDEVAVQELPVQPSEATRQGLRRLVLADFDACGRKILGPTCRVRYLAEAEGADIYGAFGGGRWWGGLVGKPTFIFDGYWLSVIGTFAYVGPRGRTEVDFRGGASYLINPDTGRPDNLYFQIEVPET